MQLLRKHKTPVRASRQSVRVRLGLLRVPQVAAAGQTEVHVRAAVRRRTSTCVRSSGGRRSWRRAATATTPWPSTSWSGAWTSARPTRSVWAAAVGAGAAAGAQRCTCGMQDGDLPIDHATHPWIIGLLRDKMVFGAEGPLASIKRERAARVWRGRRLTCGAVRCGAAQTRCARLQWAQGATTTSCGACAMWWPTPSSSESRPRARCGAWQRVGGRCAERT